MLGLAVILVLLVGAVAAVMAYKHAKSIAAHVATVKADVATIKGAVTAVTKTGV